MKFIKTITNIFKTEEERIEQEAYEEECKKLAKEHGKNRAKAKYKKLNDDQEINNKMQEMYNNE